MAPAASPACPAAPAPAPAGATLAETLAEIARRDVRLVRASSGVKVAHGHRLPALVRAVARHEGALALWLALGADAGTRAVAPGWDPEARLHAAWFVGRFTPPTVPFALAPGHTVADWPRYREAVVARLALGPDAPGADALRATLAALFERFAGAAAAPTARTEPRWSAAA